MVTENESYAKTEKLIEAHETKFSYPAATKDIFSTKDRYHRETWNDMEKRTVVATVNSYLEDVAADNFMEIDVNYDKDGIDVQSGQFKEPVTGDILEITIQMSESYKEVMDKDSRYNHMHPGLRVQVESTDPELVETYDESLEELKKFMQGMFS